MTSTWLADASRHSRHEAACGQRRLPLLPAGAPAPRAATPALPRAAAPGFRSSRPVPLEPLAPTPPPSLLMPE
ncbi:MAG: hypothetical protein KF683_01025 [Rubrivivax sp.]|nr:hypothetical protein [Rubrivivax sp.]